MSMMSMMAKTRVQPVAVALGVLFAVACGSNRGDAEAGDPCADTIDCTPGNICYNETCVGEGPLRFSLSWDLDEDIDLHVITPSGAHISYAMRNADNGVLDVDDCVVQCRNADATHVENIFFTEDASPGTYQVWAVNYDNAVETPVTIDVFIDGSLTTYTDTAPTVDPYETQRRNIDY
jgi:hypothetical protein